jgi:hypothetical protein
MKPFYGKFADVPVIRFLAPAFLWALALLIIPVLIHLFNFRRYRKVLFTNVRFLRELKEETTRMSRLKHLLVLFSRLLALAFLVFAFSRPFIPHSDKTAANTSDVVSIYIDNSFSMEGVSSQGPLLDVARNRATEIARSFPSATRFQLLTNDFSAAQQRLLTRDDFLEEVNRIKTVYSGRPLSEVLIRQKEALQSGSAGMAEVFVISDFQESMADINNLEPDSGIQLNLVALPVQAQNNLYIDSCWLESPVVQINQPVTMKVRVVNNGDKDAESVPVRLVLDGIQKAVSAVAVAGGGKAELEFSITPSTAGWQKGEVQISDHPVTFDDTYFFSFEVKSVLKVLSVNSEQNSPYLSALFENNPLFSFRQTRLEAVDYSIFSQQDLIIMNQLRQVPSGLSEEIKKYLNAGGTVCFFPDSSADLQSSNAFLVAVGSDQLNGIVNTTDRITEVDREHVLFKDVFENRSGTSGERIDFPSVERIFSIAKGSSSAAQVLLKTQAGLSFLSEHVSGRGLFFLFAVPLNPGFSNLSRHALIVPLLYRMSLLSGRAASVSAWLGENKPLLLNIPPPAGDQTFHVVNTAYTTDLIPAVRLTPAGLSIQADAQMDKAGNYDLLKGKEEVAVLSYNYNRRESDLKFMNEDQLLGRLQDSGINNAVFYKASEPDLGKVLAEINSGISLWKYCIIFCLIFLLAEILIIRFWKST